MKTAFLVLGLCTSAGLFAQLSQPPLAYAFTGDEETVEATQASNKIAYFKPDVPLEDWHGTDLSIYLVLLSSRRANEVELDTLLIDPDITGVMNYEIVGWTINDLLNKLVEDKYVVVEKVKAGDITEPLLYVRPYQSLPPIYDGDENDGKPTPYFSPDISLGPVLLGDITTTLLLRRIALEHGIKLEADDGIPSVQGLAKVNYTLNELLDELEQTGQIGIQRNGGFVYAHLPDYPQVHNRIRNDPAADNGKDVPPGTTAFSLRKARLDRMVASLSEITGKTILLHSELQLPEDDLPWISGEQGMLPLEQGLKALMEQNGLGLELADGVYYIKPRAQGVRYHDGLYDIWVEDKPLSQVISEISAFRPNEVMVLEKLEGTLSMDLGGVSLERLLDLTLLDTQYSYTREDDVFVVGGAKMPLLDHQELVKFENVHVDLVFSEMLPEPLKKTEGLVITKIASLNSLLLTGQRALVIDAAKTARLLDKTVPQVLLEVIVVEFTLGEDFSLGLQITTPDGGTIFPNISQVFQGFQDEHGNYRISRLPTNFSVILDALENDNIAKTVMKPRVATLSGIEADVTVSQTLNYRVTKEIIVNDQNSPVIRTTEEIITVTADIKLAMTPWVIGKDLLTVKISPQFDTFNGTVVDNVPPGQSQNSINSTVRLRDGETIILGGLISDRNSVDKKGIPYLRRIPLLGALFRNKKTAKQLNDMVIYVTPHIYYGDKDSPEYIRDQKKWDIEIPTDWELRKNKKKKRRSKK